MLPNNYDDFPVYEVEDGDRQDRLPRANRAPAHARDFNRGRQHRHNNFIRPPPPPPAHPEVRRHSSPTHQNRRLQQLQNEVSQLRSEASSQSRREKLLLRTVAGYHLSIRENRSIPDPPSRQYAVILHGGQDVLLNIDANESLASSLALPPLNDSVLVNSFLAMIQLGLAGDGAYTQSIQHPGVPARELFLSGSVGLSLARLNSRCADTDIRMVFAGINAIFMEVLRSCGLTNIPAVAMPLARSTLWRPDSLITSRTPNVDARAPTVATPTKDQLLRYLQTAITALTPPNLQAPGVDDDSHEEDDVARPADFQAI